MAEQQLHNRIASLEQRFNDLLLGADFAKQQLGFIKTFAIEYGEALPQRTLLEVEEAARKQRQEASTQQQQFLAQVSARLHTKIAFACDEQLNNIDHLYHEVIGIQDANVAIVDLLSARSATVGRVEPLLHGLNWLGRELVTLVNLPQYRQDRKVKIDTPALALRYFGLENLRAIIPALTMRQWLPHSTEPFGLLKRKLKDTATSRAIIAQHLAKTHGENPYIAFCGAIFLELGKVALTRLYLRYFEQIAQREIEKARKSNNKFLHDALLSMEPDPFYLRNLLSERALEVTRSIVEKMALRFLPLNALLDEIAMTEPEQRSPLAQCVSQAQSYSQILLLEDNQLIEQEEKKQWLNYIGLNEDAQQQLASVNLKHLVLQLTA